MQMARHDSSVGQIKKRKIGKWQCSMPAFPVFQEPIHPRAASWCWGELDRGSAAVYRFGTARMRRRDFVAALAGATFARSAIAQANEQKRVGVLMSTAETDPRERATISAFIKALAGLGWVEG